MKYTLIFLALFSYTFSEAQSASTNDIGFQILSALENTKAIHELTQNHQILKGQMADLEQWNRHGHVQSDEYLQLQQAYTAYSDRMNYVLDQLYADLRSLNSIKKLKGARLDRFVEKFNTLYNDEFIAANHSYTTEFAPTLQKVAYRADSKAGILGSILLILEFGETIYSGLRSLFKTGKLDRDSETQLMNLGITFAIKQLDQKLRYPSWNELISQPIDAPIANHSNSSRTMQAAYTASFTNTSMARTSPSFRSINGSVALSTFGTDSPLQLTSLSKQIIVGSAPETSVQLPMYSTSKSMANGDRFWVKLQGYDFARFFYYDKSIRAWMDPFGKSIIVGGVAGRSSEETRYLPSKQQFFEIAGDSTTEHFLILVSNAPIPSNVTSTIMSQKNKEVLFLESIVQLLPEVKSPSEANSDATHTLLDKVVIDGEHASQVLIPLYIVIEKNNHP